MLKKRIRLMALVFAFVCLGSNVMAASVYLKDGTLENGTAVWMSESTVSLSRKGEVYEFDKNEVLLEKTIRENKLNSGLPDANQQHETSSDSKPGDKNSLIPNVVGLPPPPKGYTWVSCDETKSAFLKPTGWFFKKGKQGDTWGYFVTKENIEKSGKFYTGLTVNIIPNIPETKGMPPTEYAAAFIQEGVKRRKVVTEPWENEMGPFKSFGVVLLNKDGKEGDFITHNLAIGNDATGTLYLITFEAPVFSWKAAWKKLGEPMLQRFLIDSDI